MKNKGQIWYIGYIVSLFLIVIILVTDFPEMVDIGLAILFSAVFSVSYVQILHDNIYLFRLHHSSYYCRKYHCNPADYFNHYQ